MSSSSMIVIDTGTAVADSDDLPLNQQLFAGHTNRSASAVAMPMHPGRDGFDPRLAITPRPGVGPSKPGDGLVSVAGIEMGVDQAIAAGLVVKDENGVLRPTERFVNSKTAEGAAMNAADAAMTMEIADTETEQFVEAVDGAAEAIGLGGLFPLVHAVMKTEDAGSVLNVVTPVAQQLGMEPEEVAGNLMTLIDTYGDNAARAMGLSREEFDEAFDAAVRTHGLQRVIAAAMGGARQRTFTPLVRTLRGQV